MGGYMDVEGAADGQGGRWVGFSRGRRDVGCDLTGAVRQSALKERCG